MKTSPSATEEAARVQERYARRDPALDHLRYDVLRPWVYMSVQELDRELIRWIRKSRLAPLESRTLLEIGCGHGGNLLRFLQLGFRPEHLVGNDLLESRAAVARRRLPAVTRVLVGDAFDLDFPDASFDVVFLSTVYTSILDESFRERLSERLWRLVRPGGGVLWYDFIYDNPRNPDVKGVPLRRIRELFPHGHLSYRRVTLAPPIARSVTRVHPALYSVMNVVPLLRSHVLCWIPKAADL